MAADVTDAVDYVQTVAAEYDTADFIRCVIETLKAQISKGDE